jgi:hypothetical protein
MELKYLSSTDIPSTPLAGVTTVQLAEMLFYSGPDGNRVTWDELKPELRKAYYTHAARLLQDWPSA